MATTFTIPSYNTILQSMVDSFSATATYFGYNLNVDPSSDLYLRFAVNAGQLSILYNLANALINSKLVATATGTDLDTLASGFGLTRRSASAAQGYIELIGIASAFIAAGTILNGPNSLQYQVVVSGTYTPENVNGILVQCLSTGANTNLALGQQLTWLSPPLNIQSIAPLQTVITGGSDAEDDDTFRSRIILQLQSPPQAGNDNQLCNIANSVDPLIQQAFTYSNFNGAGTQLIALTSYQTIDYIGRDLPHLPTDGYVPLYGLTILQPGLLPQIGGLGSQAYNQYSELNGQSLDNDTNAIYGQLAATIANPFATVITTVNNQPSDMAVVLDLPYPVGAAQNGVGGGWLDFNTFPNPDGYFVDDGYCSVIGVVSPYNFTIRAPSSGAIHSSGSPYVSYLAYNANIPIAGVTHISWICLFNQTVVTGKIISATDNGDDSWNIIIDTPFINPFGNGEEPAPDFYGNQQVTSGDFIFPASSNSQTYLQAVLTQYALLGPGEVTSSQGLLSLGALRFPSQLTQFPQTVGVQLERSLVISNPEVYSASVNPNSAYNTAYAKPAVNSPPNIWVPRHLAIGYDQNKYNFGL